MLYSLFAADEAAHFHWIRAYAPAAAIADGPGNPFLRLLDELLRTEDAPTLCYLVQVVLEGWGIHHYHALAKASLDADLIDTMHVAVAPVQIGKGERLWQSPDELEDRFHHEAVPSPSGVTHHLFWRR